MTRDADIAAFLQTAGWGQAAPRHLAGDASARRYLRVTRDGGDSAILMETDPVTGVPTAPFVRVARLLSAHGLIVPAILAWDEAAGLLLLEDFGDALFARLLEREPDREHGLYAAAVDVLVALHRLPVPGGFPVYTHANMAGRAALSAQWYRPGTGATPDPDGAARIEAEVGALLDRHAPGHSVIALRDFHAENLVWLPDRPGGVGLLDFQDAMAGHPAYDLVSLVEDARRDVDPGVRAAMIRRYRAVTGQDEDPFAAACAVLAAQRNLRILGVFARLCLHYGKVQYIALLPRVWAHLMRDLQHPALRPLATLVAQTLPEPTPRRLDALRKAVGTWPMP